MSEMKSVDGILDVIKSITSNRESGRLDINSCGTPGTFLFNEGQLVDARLGSLSGFQAVNAAAGLRQVEFSFDHVVPASHVSTITASERVVLLRFFGIETAALEHSSDAVEADPEWNTTPEQVVPFTELEEAPQTELEETPTVEVERLAPSHSVERAVPSDSVVGARQSAFVWRPQFALAISVCLALVIGLAVGAMALRSRMKAVQQSAAVASAVESKPSSTAEREPSSIADAKPDVTSSVSDTPTIAAADPRDTRAERDSIVRDLTGRWRVINTVQKTGYRSFDSMQIGFRLKINQRGKEFTATGEKFSENGQTLEAGRRTPIHVRGSIDGDKVVATFVEDGRARRSNGRFVWKLQRSGDALAGTFVTTAANSSGKSAMTKE